MCYAKLQGIYRKQNVKQISMIEEYAPSKLNVTCDGDSNCFSSSSIFQYNLFYT